MRIISGALGGRRFNGKIPSGVRPTSDKARGSVFNKLQNLIDIRGAIVADICAGTGAMGIECISRGAEHCTFIDSSRKSCEYIKQALINFNIDKTYYTIYNKKLEKFPEYFKATNPENKFDIIITDPPYKDNIINTLLTDIVKFDLINNDGIIIVEFALNSGIIIPNEFELIDSKNFGDTNLSFIKVNQKYINI